MAQKREDTIFNEFKDACKIVPSSITINNIEERYIDLFLKITDLFMESEDFSEFCHHGDFKDCNSILFNKNKLLFGNIIHIIQDQIIFGNMIGIEKLEIQNKLRDIKFNELLSKEFNDDKVNHEKAKSVLSRSTNKIEKKSLNLKISSIAKESQKKKKIIKDFNRIDDQTGFDFKPTLEKNIKIFSKHHSHEDFIFLLSLFDRIILFRKFDMACKEKFFTSKQIREDIKGYEKNIAIKNDHLAFISLLISFRKLLNEHSRAFK